MFFSFYSDKKNRLGVYMKRIPLLIISVFTVLAQSAFAQTAINKDIDSSNAGLENAEVSIRFYDKTMYYPGNDEDNPINVYITISNKGTSTLRFKIADDRNFSMDFAAFDVKNKQLPQTDNLRLKRSTNQTVYFREIALEPGEGYSFVENIKDYLTISDPSVYYVEMTFYPELYRAKDATLQSNRLSLEVRPSPSAVNSYTLPALASTSSNLVAEQISPDKVVEQTIVARQKSLWDQYFLYMDVEEMLKRDSVRSRKYNAASANERNEMLQTFKADLMQQRIDYDIVAIPEKFEIETTTYTKTEGTVKVLEWFKNNTYHERKRYTYFMRQRDGIWQIYDYMVDNLGTE